MDNVICQITWTKQDFIDAFVDRFGRIPTDREIDICLSGFSKNNFEDKSIEYGWDFIYEAIDNFARSERKF